MPCDENILHRANQVSATLQHSLERGETFADSRSATLAQIVGRRLRAVYPLVIEGDESPALRSLIDELAAKGI